MNIEILRDSEFESWDNMLLLSPNSRFSETTKFAQVLKKTYRYPAAYLLIKDGEKIIALLPTIRKGKSLISMPFADYGDLIIFQQNINAENLIQKILDFLGEHKLKNLKIISGLCLQNQIIKKYFHQEPNDARAILELENNQDELFKKFDYSVRKAINKAKSSDIKCFEDNANEAIKKYFYPLYLKSMKRFGTPPHSLTYFLNKSIFFGKQLKIFHAFYNEVPIASLMGFACGKTIQITKNPSDKKFWQLRPNDLLHWEFMKWGIENSYEFFDFGPVRYENQKRYKEKWGAKILDNYNFYLPREKSQSSWQWLSADSKFIKLSALIWKYFIPTNLSRHLGPILRKRVGR